MKTVVRHEIDKIRPCPTTPNCVSSIDREPQHFIAPLHYTGPAADARRRLLEVLASLKRTRVVVKRENYIRAESVSAVMRFVDDLEFLFDASESAIHVKSASRVGYYDLGVNRRRVEKIRERFNKWK